jgi:hypothetical protein
MLDEFIALEGDAKQKRSGIWAKVETPKVLATTTVQFPQQSFSSSHQSSNLSNQITSSKSRSSHVTTVKMPPPSPASWMKVKWVTSLSSSSLSSRFASIQTGAFPHLKIWEPQENINSKNTSNPWYKRYIGSFCLFNCSK